METTVDNYGRIVIPKSIRKQLNLSPGEHLIIELIKDRIILKPLVSDTKVINEDGLLVLDGTLTDENSILDMIDKTREERLSGSY